VSHGPQDAAATRKLPPHLFLINDIPQRIMANFNAALYLDDDGFELDYSTPRTSGAFSSPAGSRGGSPIERNQQQKGARGLPLLQLSEWDPCIDDEANPTCIHYSIEWKLQVKEGRLSTLTEITGEPYSCTERVLGEVFKAGPRGDSARQTAWVEPRTRRDQSYRVCREDERDLRKRFDRLDIEWKTVEDKLKAWSQLFREGKKLRIDISFIYKENSQPAAMRTRSSTTKKQLAARNKLLTEQEEASGRPPCLEGGL